MNDYANIPIKLPQKPISTTYKWEDIQQAVNSNDRQLIRKIGLSYDKPRLEQEGVQIEEVKQQIISMAPGNHPHLGPILLDLAAKLYEKDSEWH